jgi:hypothetical protein
LDFVSRFVSLMKALAPFNPSHFFRTFRTPSALEAASSSFEGSELIADLPQVKGSAAGFSASIVDFQLAAALSR